MAQPTLLDHLARMGDPQPSQQAAALDRSTLLLRVLGVLVAHGAQSAAEVHARLADPTVKENSVSRRLTTLAKRGLAVRAGTKRGSCGADVTVWTATNNGRAVQRG